MSKIQQQLMTLGEAASVLRCSIRQVREIINRGEIQYFQRKKGAQLYIEEGDLATFIEEHKRCKRCLSPALNTKS